MGGTATCDFKSGQLILQQGVERSQMSKLLATGRTDLLDGFVSSRTSASSEPSWSGTRKEGRFRVRGQRARPGKTAAEDRHQDGQSQVLSPGQVLDFSKGLSTKAADLRADLG